MKFTQGVLCVKFPNEDKKFRDGYFYSLVDLDDRDILDNTINLFVGKNDSDGWSVAEPITGVGFDANGKTRKQAVEESAKVLQKFGIKYTRNAIDIYLVETEKKNAVFTPYGFKAVYNAVPRYAEKKRESEAKRTGKYNYHRGVVEQY